MVKFRLKAYLSSTYVVKDNDYDFIRTLFYKSQFNALKNSLNMY